VAEAAARQSPSDQTFGVDVHVPDIPTLKTPAQWTLLGTPVTRLDTPDKLIGKAMFGVAENQLCVLTSGFFSAAC
jgi:hypothetical protein